jgi:hypothetical protein
MSASQLIQRGDSCVRGNERLIEIAPSLLLLGGFRGLFEMMEKLVRQGGTDVCANREVRCLWLELCVQS